LSFRRESMLPWILENLKNWWGLSQTESGSVKGFASIAAVRFIDLDQNITELFDVCFCRSETISSWQMWSHPRQSCSRLGAVWNFELTLNYLQSRIENCMYRMICLFSRMNGDICRSSVVLSNCLFGNAVDKSCHGWWIQTEAWEQVPRRMSWSLELKLHLQREYMTQIEITLLHQKIYGTAPMSRERSHIQIPTEFSIENWLWQLKVPLSLRAPDHDPIGIEWP
jgi:hypothetical protein